MKVLWQTLGLKIIEEANNLKRTKEALAQELNISLTNLEKIIQGNCSLNESNKNFSNIYFVFYF